MGWRTVISMPELRRHMPHKLHPSCCRVPIDSVFCSAIQAACATKHGPAGMLPEAHKRCSRVQSAERQWCLAYVSTYLSRYLLGKQICPLFLETLL